MTMSVSGSAMIAISPTLSPTKNALVLVQKFLVLYPYTSAATSAKKSIVSQRTRARHGAPMSDDMAGLAGGLEARHAQGEHPVDGDRQQQQGAGDGLVPERRHLGGHERLVDRVQQQRAEGGAVHRAAAAEDRHPAHHDGGDDVEFVAGAAGGVDGGELRQEQRPGEAGERTTDDERGEHPAPAGHPGELGGPRVGPDGVEVAPGSQRAHAVAGHEHHDEHEDREPWHHATYGLVPDALVRAWDRRRVDLLATYEAGVDAADDVEHRQGHHEARHTEHRGDESVDRPDRRADDDAEGERHQDRRGGMVTEEHADGVGG